MEGPRGSDRDQFSIKPGSAGDGGEVEELSPEAEKVQKAVGDPEEVLSQESGDSSALAERQWSVGSSTDDPTGDVAAGVLRTSSGEESGEVGTPEPSTPPKIHQMETVSNVVGEMMTGEEVSQLVDFLHDKEAMAPHIQKAMDPDNPNGAYIHRSDDGKPPRSIALFNDGGKLRTMVEVKTLKDYKVPNEIAEGIRVQTAYLESLTDPEEIAEAEETLYQLYKLLPEEKEVYLKNQKTSLGAGGMKVVRKVLDYDNMTLEASGRVKGDAEAGVQEAELQKQYGSGLGFVRTTRKSGEGEMTIQYTKFGNHGDMTEIGRKTEKWNELRPEQRKEIVMGLFSKVHHLHGDGLKHQDIGLDNFLLEEDDEGHYGIGMNDLGYAVPEGNTDNPYVGTPEFWSPDLQNWRDQPRTQADDQFAMGIILWGLTHQPNPSTDDKVPKEVPPWLSNSYQEFGRERDRRIVNPEAYPDQYENLAGICTTDVEKIAYNLMHPDPDQRLSLDEALGQLSDVDFNFDKLPVRT